MIQLQKSELQLLNQIRGEKILMQESKKNRHMGVTADKHEGIECQET